MNGFPNSPRLVKGGIVTMDPDTSAVQGVIALQYNPDSLSRPLQIQAVQGGQDGVRVNALRLRGPAVETIKIEAELDATDQLEFPGKYPLAVQYGLHPQLAQLDREQIGRVLVKVPDARGEIPSSWAMPCVPAAGIQSGCFIVPPIGSQVWVEFEQGDPDYPIWAGGFWGLVARCPSSPLRRPPFRQARTLSCRPPART